MDLPERSTDGPIVAWSPQSGPQSWLLTCPVPDILFGGARGGGKMQPLGEPVLTPKGWRPIGSLRVGDHITDPVGGGTQAVIGVYPHPAQRIWRITFDDGASARAGDEHLWLARLARQHRPGSKDAAQRVITRQQLGVEYQSTRWDAYRVGDTVGLRGALDRGASPRIPLTDPVLFSVNGRTGGGGASPYAIGALLGDGALDALTVTCCEDGMRDAMLSEGFRAGSDLHTDGKPKAYRAIGPLGATMRAWVRNHGLVHHRSWEKFIPPYVFTAHIAYRIALLQGLMDTDGYVDERGRCYFGTTSPELASGVQVLVRSLGGKARIAGRQTSYPYLGELRDGRPSYRVRIWLPQTSALFRLARKRSRCADSWNGGYELSREVTDMVEESTEEAVCIRVNSPHGLYLTRDYIVTHNSDGLIGDWCAHAARSGGYARGILMRRSMPQLEEIMVRAREILAPLGASWMAGTKIWHMPCGSTLKLRWLDRDADADEYQGHSYDWIGIDELGSFPDPSPVDKMRATLRSAKGVPCVMRATANPLGPGHQWIKERYIDPSPPLVPFEDKARHTWRVFIPSRVKDNAILLANDPGYIDRLKSSGPPWLVRAWLDGDWSASAGQTFFAESALLLEGKPVVQPRADVIFAVVDTAMKDGNDHDGTAVVYFAVNSLERPKLVILDWDVLGIESDLLSAWLPSVEATLEALSRRYSSRRGWIGPYIEDKASGITLLQHAAKHNMRAQAIPQTLTSLGKEGRCLNVGGYVYRGDVKITEDAYTKVQVFHDISKNHLLSQVCGFVMGEKNPHAMDLLDCFTYGVALALGNSEGF